MPALSPGRQPQDDVSNYDVEEEGCRTGTFPSARAIAEPLNDEVASRYIFDRGAMRRLLLLRVRCIQGHAGETMRNMTRIGQ